MENIGREIESKSKNGYANASDRAQNLGNSVEKFSNKLGNDLGAMAGQVTTKLNDYVKTTKDYVETNPLQSVAIAAAAGAAMGCLITLAASRRK